MTATHREQKKQRTYHALIKSAHQLFAKKGYEATTLEEIARKANCSPRTFFQYLSSKEELLFVGFDELWHDLAKALSARSPGTTTLRCTHDWALDMARHLHGGGKTFTQLFDHKLGGAKSSVQARARFYSMERLESVLAPEFAKDLGRNKDDTSVRILATATAAIFNARHSDLIGGGTDMRDYLNTSFAVLESGFQALQAKRGA